MKLLIISDLHLDWVTHGISRYEELKSALFEQIMDKVVAEKVDVVVFLGDLCDPDSGPIVYRAIATMISLARKLATYGVDFVAIPGNHDIVEDGSGTTTLTPLAALSSDNAIYVYERPAMFDLRESATVITLPYVATSHAYDPDAWVKEALAEAPKGKPVIVMGHMTVIPGVTPGEEATEMPRGRDVRFPIEACGGVDLLLNGHFHRQQRTESGIWIPGSLARLTFGEVDHEPGYLIAEV